MNVQILKYYHFAIFRDNRKYVPLSKHCILTILWHLLCGKEGDKVECGAREMESGYETKVDDSEQRSSVFNTDVLADSVAM